MKRSKCSASREFGIQETRDAPGPPNTRRRRRPVRWKSEASARFSSKFGVGALYDVGAGVCHQVVPERSTWSRGCRSSGRTRTPAPTAPSGLSPQGVGSTDAAAVLALGKLWFRVSGEHAHTRLRQAQMLRHEQRHYSAHLRRGRGGRRRLLGALTLWQAVVVKAETLKAEWRVRKSGERRHRQSER